MPIPIYNTQWRMADALRVYKVVKEMQGMALWGREEGERQDG